MAVPQQGFKRKRSSRDIEGRIVVGFLVAATLITIVTTVAIVFVLLSDSISFFLQVPLLDFLWDTEWDPPVRFGIWPLINGTLLIAGIAGVVALVLGMGSAIFLSEYAPHWLRQIVKPVLEILAGIPTVVYGYFALLTVTPLLRGILGTDVVPQFNAFSAGIVMGILIMPLVSTLVEDAMLSVPRSLRYSAYALGATRAQVIFKVVLPAALSGIISAFILALSRAVGETLIVTIAAGLQPNLTIWPFESVQPITSAIVRTVSGEAPRGSLEYQSIFAIGLVLFLMTLGLNLIGRWVVSKYRLRYNQ